MCVCLYAFSFLLVSILMSFLSEFSLILDGLELHFWFIWRSGGSQGLPWGALGFPWALISDGLELHFWFIWRSGGPQALPWGASGSPWALVLDGFELHFWFISAPEGLWGSSGALWGPLERQGGPKRGPMSEKMVRWTPLGSQPGVIFS